MRWKLKPKKAENIRLKEKYFSLCEPAAKQAIDSVDLADTDKHYWAIRKNRANFLRFYKYFTDNSQGAKQMVMFAFYPVVILAYIIQPLVISLSISFILVSLVCSTSWFICVYLGSFLKVVYIICITTGVILQISKPLQIWYHSSIAGTPRVSPFNDFSSHVLKHQWIKIFTIFYTLLLAIAFIAPPNIVGDFQSYYEMLLFNLDVIANTILFGLPESLYGNFSKISVQTWQGKLLVTGLKLMIAAGIISAFSSFVKRIREPSSVFVGSTRELIDYLVSSYRTGLSRISVLKVGTFELQKEVSVPGWFFTIARSVESGLEINYPGIGGRDFRNVMREVSIAGLKQYLKDIKKMEKQSNKADYKQTTLDLT